MSIFMTIRIALRSLNTNKVRTALTMLGIIVGIASVIIVISAGSSARAVIQGELEGFGANLLSVSPGKLGIPGTGGDVLKYEYFERSQRPNLFKHINYSIPSLRISRPVNFKDTTKNAIIVGAPETIFSASDFSLKLGRLYDTHDNKKASSVAVLGATLAKDLFENEDPIGKTIKIERNNWTVIGVLEEKGSISGSDNSLYAPFRSVQTKLKKTDSIDEWNFIAHSTNDVEKAKSEIRTFLRDQMKLREGQEDTFRIDTVQDFIKTSSEILFYINAFLSLIAGISLIVAGIGIMNIMLATVTERTREIGLRKAIGARYIDILQQFLVESLVLTLIGASIGTFCGIIITIFVVSIAGWIPKIPILGILIAIGSATILGLLFGYYPAKKAAQMDPILALKSE